MAPGSENKGSSGNEMLQKPRRREKIGEGRGGLYHLLIQKSKFTSAQIET